VQVDELVHSDDMTTPVSSAGGGRAGVHGSYIHTYIHTHTRTHAHTQGAEEQEYMDQHPVLAKVPEDEKLYVIARQSAGRTRAYSFWMQVTQTYTDAQTGRETRNQRRETEKEHAFISKPFVSSKRNLLRFFSHLCECVWGGGGRGVEGCVCVYVRARSRAFVCVCVHTGAGGAAIFSLAARIDRHSRRYISFIDILDCRMLET